MRNSFCGIVPLMATLGGLMAQEPSVGVGPVGLHGQKAGIPEFAVFGGETIKLELPVEAPLGSKVSLLYDLLQTAGGLAAPLEMSRPIGTEIHFEKTTHRMVSVELSVPKVLRRSKMLVKFYTSVPAGKSSSGAGRAFLQVYPKEEPGRLGRALAATEKRLRLGIFGESPALRGFCNEQQIEFEDLGSRVPDRWEKNVLYLGEITAATLDEPHLKDPGANAIFFVTDSTGPPGIYRTSTPAGSLTKVTLPILENLAVNPQSRQIFIDTLQHALNPTPPATP